MRARVVSASELSAKKGLRAKDYLPKPEKPKKKPKRPPLRTTAAGVKLPAKIVISDSLYDMIKNFSGVSGSRSDRNHELSLVDYAVSCHEASKKKGWWKGKNNDLFRKLLMSITELCEMVDVARQKNVDLTEVWLEKDEHGQLKPEGFPVEAADLFIRLMDMMGRYKIDLERAVKIKMAFNEGRPFLHGGKQI